ncbi:MAG TPA: PqqD family peptide modification chaperone [Ectothiorhodospiraceae bacterium]|nr:PqqD family peptide modification chaperone [Ectothiorhodospiraceae bacterium]
MDHAHYFKRTAVYKVEENEISVVDVHENNTITPLDPWMGAVVSLADGQHTIAQLIQHMSAQYPDGAPEKLTETLESVIDRLTETDVIELTLRPSILPYYLRLPMNEQDPKQATEMMINDGFLKPPTEQTH